MIDGLYAKQVRVVEQKKDSFFTPDRFILQRMLGS